MKNYFPEKNKQYIQTNRSNILGNLWSTFNLDFQTNLGAMRLSQKLVINTSSTDDANLGRASAFEYFDSRWFAICGTRVFKNTSESLVSAFSADASTGFQTNYGSDVSDLAIFDNRLWSTTATTLYSKVQGSGTGAWTSRDTLGTAVHKLSYFKKFDRLYYSDTTTAVSSIDTANTPANSAGDYFIELGTSIGEITTIASNSQYIWIGTLRTSNVGTGNGVFGTISQWDGISAQVTNEYKLNSAGCLALTIYNDVPYAIDTEGRILKYTGYSFEEIGRLPIDRVLLLATISAGSASIGRFVHFNGLTSTKNNTLQVLINNLNYNSADSGPIDGTINENLQSGIWEFDLSTNSFTHRYSFTLKTVASSTVTDYGQNRILGAGALKVNTLQSDISSGKSILICGCSYYQNLTTTRSAIFIDSPAKQPTSTEGQKKGCFITNFLESDEIANAWDSISASFKTLATEGDSVIFKYRTTEVSPVEASITWVDSTNFTVLNSAVDVSQYWTENTGGEVEITLGTGGGSCSHIINAVNNAGTWTVTLDETIPNVTGTAKARFQKWIKLYPKEELSQISTYLQSEIGTDSTPRIQIKGCLTWTGDGEFYKSIITSNEDIKSQ